MNTFKPGLFLDPRRKSHPLLSALASKTYVVPPFVDSLGQMLPPNDQLNTPQCVGFGTTGWIEYYRWKEDEIYKQLDAPAVYEEAKKFDGFPEQEGTTLNAGVQAAINLGLMPELDERGTREVTKAVEVQRGLHKYGVVLAAFDITDKWVIAGEDGLIPDGGKNIGGHCVVLIAYNIAQRWFGGQGSWGEGHGYNGYFKISFDQFDKDFKYGLCWDFKK